MKGLKRKIEYAELEVVINEEDEFEKEMALLNAAIEESENVPPPPPPPLEDEDGKEEEELEEEKESIAGGDEEQERDSEEYQRQIAELHSQDRSQKRIDRLKEKRSKVTASAGTSQDSSISKLKQIKKQRVVKPFDSSDEDSE